MMIKIQLRTKKDEIIIKNKQDFSLEKFLPELRIHNHTGRNEENYGGTFSVHQVLQAFV